MFKLLKKRPRKSDVVVYVRIFPENTRIFSEIEFARYRDTRRGWHRAYSAIDKAAKIHGVVNTRIFVLYFRTAFLPNDVREEIRARGWIR